MTDVSRVDEIMGLADEYAVAANALGHGTGSMVRKANGRAALRAEIEKIMQERDINADFISAHVISRAERAEAECAELRKDAARYRNVRARVGEPPASHWYIPGGGMVKTPEEFDAAIDDAIAKEPRETE